MSRSYLLFLLILSSNFLLSQKTVEQFQFQIDNDKLALEDKYYTSGLLLNYKKSLGQTFIFKKDSTNKIQLNFTIGNKIYTPTNLSSFDVNDFDRPFAGWLYGKLEIGNIKKKSAAFITFETGVTGKESLSGSLQVWFHDTFEIDNFASWIQEISFKWLFNLKYKYVYELYSNPQSTFQYEFHPSIGTKDIFLENNFHYFFGKLNPLKNSSRIETVDETKTNEFFGLISLGHKYVAHNTLIQGSIFKHDILFTTKATKHILQLRLGGVYKNKRNTFKLIYNVNSKETRLSTSHVFGTFVYSRDF